MHRLTGANNRPAPSIDVKPARPETCASASTSCVRHLDGRVGGELTLSHRVVIAVYCVISAKCSIVYRMIRWGHHLRAPTTDQSLWATPYLASGRTAYGLNCRSDCAVRFTGNVLLSSLGVPARRSRAAHGAARCPLRAGRCSSHSRIRYNSGRRMNSVTTLEYSARQIFMTMNTKTCSYS